MTNLFAYGSLMCSDILFKVAGCQPHFTQATLHNFFRSKIRGREYPGIVPHSGTRVSGVLYLDLANEAIRRLDAFEGELYQRQDVEIMTGDCASAMAMTYVIKPQYSDLLTNKEWSFKEFLSAGKARFEETYFGFDAL